jgi:hypothetical protein
MRRRAYVAVAILAVLTVGACSHDSASNGGKAAGALSRGEVTAPGAALAPVPAGPAVRGSYGGSGGGTVAGQLAVKLPLNDGTYQIRTAQMTVAIKGWRNVAAKADAAIAIAEGKGGEVESDDRTTGRHATAALRLRVPPYALQATLRALSKLGVEKSRQLSTTDVTQRVVDVNSRVLSAQDSIDRLRKLFHGATKVSNLIAIENELNVREAELESLQAQQRSLARRTELATIALGLVTAPKHAAPVKHHKKRGGFLGGLERGWNGFTAAAAWVASAVGTILPFLLLGLVLAFAFRLLWTRMPHRPAPAPTPSE